MIQLTSYSLLFCIILYLLPIFKKKRRTFYSHYNDKKSYFKNFTINQLDVSNIPGLLVFLIYFIHKKMFKWTIQTRVEKIKISENNYITLEFANENIKDNIILFSPGFTANSNGVYNESIINQYVSLGYSFCIFWRRGIQFYTPDSSYSPIGFVSDFEIVIKHLVELGYKNIFLINNSMGGYSSLRYLCEPKYKKPKNLKGSIFISVGPKIKTQLEKAPIILRYSSHKKIISIIKQLNKYKEIDMNLDLIKLIGEIERINSNITPDEYFDSLEFSEDDFSNISVPCIFINSENDNISKINYMKKIIPSITMSKKTLVIVTKFGFHCLYPKVNLTEGITYSKWICMLLENFRQYILDNEKIELN
jgi:predicted alpha/beta-fold hydrolase